MPLKNNSSGQILLLIVKMQFILLFCFVLLQQLNQQLSQRGTNTSNLQRLLLIEVPVGISMAECYRPHLILMIQFWRCNDKASGSAITTVPQGRQISDGFDLSILAEENHHHNHYNTNNDRYIQDIGRGSSTQPLTQICLGLRLGIACHVGNIIFSVGVCYSYSCNIVLQSVKVLNAF